MKAMTKQQLAQCAGVTVTTLMNWCRPHLEELQRMGLQPNSRVLSPRIVKYLADLFCIDVKAD
jgi:hypothetical protein